MKKPIILAILIAFSIGCNKEKKESIKSPDQTSLVGQYKLIEILADPGDGSGTFQAVNSNKVVQFYSDSTITSNGDLCSMSEASGSPSSGTYSLADSVITVNNCLNMYFEISGNELIINYACIEPCRAKFEREIIAVP